MRLTYIGTIQTPFGDREGMPIQPTGAKDVQGRIILHPEYEQGLSDIDGFSHLILLYHFHQSDGFDLMLTPFMDTKPRGLFSTRAPRRPNPIGLSIVRLVGRKENTLDILDIDVLNNTPLIDIKPYVPGFDAKTEHVRSGWLEKNQAKAQTMTSDSRFI
nr:tRNA (N6-threonylcarbamoyladenosine(37)-N6)-methyltransferase TrmO [uncultured Desulfobacter sp.]